MTTKHNAKSARANLWVAKQRAAEAMSAPQKHAFEARQRSLRDATRAARALAAQAERAAKEAAEKPKPATNDAGAEAEAPAEIATEPKG